MTSFLVSLFSAGKLPPGEAQVALTYEGWNPGWAVFAALALLAGTAALYFLPRGGIGHELPRARLILLAVLRGLLFAAFLFLLTRPVLLVTVEEPIRRTLLVLLDLSRSMNLRDARVAPDDVHRAAIASGEERPKADAPLSRLELLRTLAANPKLALWPRLYEKADLEFYGFSQTSRGLADLGSLAPAPGAAKLEPRQAAAFFGKIEADGNGTALGDALRELLDKKRGHSLAGILVVTDGASNGGIPPAQAAAVAAHDRVPLFVYGIGIVSPIDIVVGQLSGPATVQAKEKTVFTARVRGLGMVGRKAVVVLKADGKQVDERPVDFHDDGEQEVALSYEPPKTGAVLIEASVAPVEGEAVTTNNASSLRVRVTDDKMKVLLIEQVPRWDFETLLALLQRDRHFLPKAVVLDGDDDLAQGADTPYLAALPATAADLAAYQAIVLGDVDPTKLGTEAMGLLADWVDKGGGGLVFLAGPRFNPMFYKGTPLEPLIPVELPDGGRADAYPAPVPLRLTPAGTLSPLLALANDPSGNEEAWGRFPGVSWTARVGRARPTAQALLVDPTPDRANRDGPMPVAALQNYGSGQVLFLGTQETYRWRSKRGERDHARLWGQILQTLGGSKGSGTVRLRSNRSRYVVGDKIVLSATILPTPSPASGGEAAPIPATLVVQPPASAEGDGAKAPAAQSLEIRLFPVPGRPGEYRGEAPARFAGSASVTVPQDPAATLRFDVDELNAEMAETAMNERLLRAVAEAGKGTFLREEDLDRLPALVAARSEPEPVFRKIEIVFAPWILAVMLLVAAAEWIIRRLSRLK